MSAWEAVFNNQVPPSGFRVLAVGEAGFDGLAVGLAGAVEPECEALRWPVLPAAAESSLPADEVGTRPTAATADCIVPYAGLLFNLA